MSTAIIVCFSYNNTKKQLSGSVIDLYIANKFFTERNYKTYCITDFDENYPNFSIIKDISLNKGVVENDINEIFNKDNIKYKSIDLILDISKIVNEINTDKICFYFSGHSIKKELYVTDKSLINIGTILSLFNNIKNQILIFDSCYVDIPLKYKYVNKKMDKQYNLDDDNDNNITCIASSQTYERSFSTNAGSLFTRYFFQMIENIDVKNIEYINYYLSQIMLCKDVTFIQNISFMTSYDMKIPKLPDWF